ncbi:MAG: hypothetical protein MUP85_12715, partial [Candidatus Lokiarchaeota archaeon]|nr:hypothetical protein [Candidatus Lokiarchaeota archaeon]
GSCVLGVQAEATTLSKFFSLMSAIISFCPLSVQRKACVFEMTTSSSPLAYSTSLLQSIFPLILMPH